MGTLRLRLALWHALVLSVILLVFAVLIYGVVRDQLIRHHDTNLTGTARAVERILSSEADCETLTAAQRAELERLGPLVLVHEAGGERRVFFQSADQRGIGALIGSKPDDAPIPISGRFEVLGTEAEPIRVYWERYRSRSGRAGLIQVAQGLGDVPLPLASLRWALFLMSPLAVVLAALGGYILAKRALAPVAEVTRLAREIEAGSLSRRLPLPHSEDEIGSLVTTLNQMIGRLEAAFEAMRRFTADASHELRGPLATMRGAIDVALAQPREAPEYREALLSVGYDVDRLRSITADLLVLARADAGRIPMERAPVRLDVLAREIAETAGGAAPVGSVQVAVEAVVPVIVAGDERWLRQLVFNLVHNAVKFAGVKTTNGPQAHVCVSVSAESGRGLLSVSDDGPGIPDDKIGHVFERFYRADPARTHGEQEGSGLGLSIAAWIAVAHQGEIRVENLDQGGCRFVVSLPLASD
jgi:heavy metal sensor kinase